MRIKDISKWERLKLHGVDVLSNAELLAVVLQKGWVTTFSCFCGHLLSGRIPIILC